MYLIGRALGGRAGFARFLVGMGLHGRAAEVGTHRGAFAARFMEDWSGRLTCVDHWDVPEGYEGQAAGLTERGPTRRDDFEAARDVLHPFFPRVCFLKMLSVEAATVVRDASMDFVYLDGDHRPFQFSEDVFTWWPKVRPGGVLAGHDAVCLPGVDNWGDGIQCVLEEFTGKRRLDVNLVPEPNPVDPWSWYVVKPMPKEGEVG